MNKAAIYQLLTDRHIWHEIIEHPAVYTMADLAQVTLPHPEAEAKNLFLRDDHHANDYLVTLKGDRRLDLKAFRKTYGTRRLSFASAAELQTMLGLKAGAVTPLGLLNDAPHQVHFYIDAALLEAPGIIGVHPNDNTATVYLKTADLIELIKDHGNPVTVMTQ